MSAQRERTHLRATRDGDEIVLVAPDVGHFRAALPRGAALAPGMVAGTLRRLGRAVDLVVPEGAAGAVVSDPPHAVMAPVGFGDVLYRLDPAGAALQASDDAGPEGDLDAGSGAAVLRAEQSGRVWHSPAPGEPPFCAPGDAVAEGAPVCLIEVMKTFSTVPYRATGGLPERATVVRWLAADGADVQAGDALLAVERA
ncbi:MAG: biotin/lipoyl-containing protein [Planctomycetota bacterium]